MTFTFETKKPTLYIYRGMPGVGKSTDALRFVSEKARRGELAVIVERDVIRRNLDPNRTAWYTPDFEERVTEVQYSKIKAGLALEADVISSDTNLPNNSVRNLMKIAVRNGADVEVLDMRDPGLYSLEFVLARNESRPAADRVDEKWLVDRYNRFIKGKELTNPEPPAADVELEIEPYVQPEDRTNRAWIFDIDGTLAVMGDRNPYDGHLVHLDTLNHAVGYLMNLIQWDDTVYVVSGRDEKYREVTEKWLSENNLFHDGLYMRWTQPNGERKIEDSVVKHKLFQEHIAPKGHYIAGVFDDRHRVLRMWRKLGLTTFHINGPDAGDF